MSAMMSNLATFWEYLSYVDQCLVFVFAPMTLWLFVKVNVLKIFKAMAKEPSMWRLRPH